MSSDKPDHATLEAQRRRSNVYAFRRLKWGAPERIKSRASQANGKAALPLAKSGRGRALTVGLLVAIGFVCGVIAVVALG
jgi:hypothetical protein